MQGSALRVIGARKPFGGAKMIVRFSVENRLRAVIVPIRVDLAMQPVTVAHGLSHGTIRIEV